MIAFNAILLSPTSGGISTYMINLIKWYESLTPKNFIKIYLSKDQFNHYSRLFSLTSTQTPLPSNKPIQRIIKENIYWNRQLYNDKIKIFHSPISYLPFNLKVKSVITIHDLRVYRFPETYAKPRMIYLKNAIKKSIISSDRIIVVSNFTKNEIIDLFNIKAEKIEVIHEGLNLEPFRGNINSLDNLVLEKYGINKPYVFIVGHLEPRKNFLMLVKAFDLLIKENDDFQLVICGKENYNFKKLYKYINKRDIRDRIVFTGFITDDDLRALYRNALIFVFPSIYEGFGFPPLESLAAGVPVAASDVSSIPEILGNAAIYFNPYSVDDILNKMCNLIYDRESRKKIMTNSKNILKKYSWENCATKHIELYKKLLDDT